MSKISFVFDEGEIKLRKKHADAFPLLKQCGNLEQIQTFGISAQSFLDFMKATLQNRSWPTHEPAKLLQFVEMAHLLRHDRLAQEVFQRVVDSIDVYDWAGLCMSSSFHKTLFPLLMPSLMDFLSDREKLLLVLSGNKLRPLTLDVVALQCLSHFSKDREIQLKLHSHCKNPFYRSPFFTTNLPPTSISIILELNRQTCRFPSQTFTCEYFGLQTILKISGRIDVSLQKVYFFIETDHVFEFKLIFRKDFAVTFIGSNDFPGTCTIDLFILDRKKLLPDDIRFQLDLEIRSLPFLENSIMLSRKELSRYFDIQPAILTRLPLAVQVSLLQNHESWGVGDVVECRIFESFPWEEVIISNISKSGLAVRPDGWISETIIWQYLRPRTSLLWMKLLLFCLLRSHELILPGVQYLKKLLEAASISSAFPSVEDLATFAKEELCAFSGELEQIERILITEKFPCLHFEDKVRWSFICEILKVGNSKFSTNEVWEQVNKLSSI